MFGISEIRLAIGAAIVAALGFLLWHDHHMSRLFKAERAHSVALTATLKAERKAKVAEVAHVQENSDTTQLRADNPLHGGLCDKPRVQAVAAKRLNGGSSTTAADIQPVPAGDSGARGQSGPDVRAMLDVLAARADEVSAELREWQGR